MTGKTIAVFGSATVQSQEPHYMDALEVGRALCKAGYSVMTGGYAGVMEAVSRGGCEVGGHVIGVTTAILDAIRPEGPNQWVMQEIKYATLRERVGHLIMEPDGYVVMPGGLGTLNELIMVWELMRVGEVPQRPIVCYGTYWENILAELMKSPYIPPHFRDMLSFAHSPEEVVTLLQNGQAS